MNKYVKAILEVVLGGLLMMVFWAVFIYALFTPQP